MVGYVLVKIECLEQGNRSRLNILEALNLSGIGVTIVRDSKNINSELVFKFRESYPLAYSFRSS